MELLRELVHLQERRGYLDDGELRALADRRNVPLYRLEGLVSFYPLFRRTPPPRVTVQVCRDVSCAMAGCNAAVQRLRAECAGRRDVEIHEVSCLGRCDAAPAVALNDHPLAPVTLNGFDQVLSALQSPEPRPVPSNAPSRTWNCDPYQNPVEKLFQNSPRPRLRGRGVGGEGAGFQDRPPHPALSPADGEGGSERASERYSTVRELIASGQDVAAVCIQRLREAGLRGMGGAGFPTGTKWELVAQQTVFPKYVICNADESEPGTFKDRAILAELPHLVIEGLLLAGLTIGAEQGIIYLRHEYGPEQRFLENALEDARARGILGLNAAGSGRRFDIEIFVSPGGYILGEETALLQALEDERGEPRNKPPFPGTHGLWGRPTLINNVETFALATSIIHHGVEWWRRQGHNGHAGLKVISISGDVERPGVYEIPVGLSVREAIQLAGGLKEGRPLLAFLPGGASSNFLPASAVDTPLEFDAMRRAGSMLGTGAIIVMAEGRDLFALATNLVRFFRNESCGKCVPCRVGSEKAVELLEGIPTGARSADELPWLSELGETLAQTSICGLGQVALNPVLSLLRHFPDAAQSDRA